MPKRQAIAPCRQSCRARHQREADASVDREDAAPVVEAGQRVDVSVIEQEPPQWSGAGICGDARWQNQADAAAASHQLKRSLDEQLVAVDVSPRVDRVDACAAHELGEQAGIAPPRISDGIDAAVAAHHVPRRVADDGVESRVRSRAAVGVDEHFGKRQRPVKEPALGGNSTGAVEQRVNRRCWQRAAGIEDGGGKIGKQRASRAACRGPRTRCCTRGPGDGSIARVACRWR